MAERRLRNRSVILEKNGKMQDLDARSAPPVAECCGTYIATIESEERIRQRYRIVIM
jgi:hypothetical protein